MPATATTTTSSAGGLPARLTELAPGLTAAFVREALHRAIHGIGPLPAAAVAADRQLIARKGDVDRTIHDMIETHVRYAGAQGFLTNLGGLTTMAFTVPTNISGLALVECRMIAAIAHLRHYDLHDPRVRNAVLVCLLGEEAVTSLVADLRIPAPPMALATAPAHDPGLDRVISAEVASDLIAKVAGKKMAGTVARRIPLVGGLVGMGADGYATWKIGRYADRELLPLARR
ncbi:MAG: EcsC family protein [Nocardioides sp.]